MLFRSGLLLAKRLVKGDIKFIEVSSGGWDTHTDNFTKLDDRVKELDDGVSALVQDLESEGLLDSTLIVIATEFGRTPKINVNTGEIIILRHTLLSLLVPVLKVECLTAKLIIQLQRL